METDVIEPEFINNPEKASKAQGAAVMIEAINLALYGGLDPWNIDSIYEHDAPGVPAIERGYQAYAISKLTGEKILVKYDPNSREELLLGSETPLHVASIVMGDDEYSIYAKTEEYHSDSDEDSLRALFELLEDNESDEEISVARGMDLSLLPEDFSIEIFKNLPRDAWFLKTLGKFGVQFAELALDGDQRVAMIANAEGAIAEASQNELIRGLETDTGISAIDGATAMLLAQRLKDEFIPDRY